MTQPAHTSTSDLSAYEAARSILRTFNNDGVPYCLLHGSERLCSLLLNNDLDIAVPRESLVLAERSLATCGQIVQLLHYVSSGFYFVLRHTSESGQSYFSAVDLAYDYRRDGRVFISQKELLQGISFEDEISKAAPIVELRYLLMKKLGKRQMPVHQRKRIAFLQRQLGSLATLEFSELFGSHHGRVLEEQIVAEDWEALEAAIMKLRRSLRHRLLFRHPLNPLRYWLADLPRRWQRFRYPSGLAISICGSDQATRAEFLRELTLTVQRAFRHTRVSGWPKTTHGPRRLYPRRRWLQFKGLRLRSTTFSSQLSDLFTYVCKVRPLLCRSTLVISDCGDLYPGVSYQRGPRRQVGLPGKQYFGPDLTFVLPEKHARHLRSGQADCNDAGEYPPSLVNQCSSTAVHYFAGGERLHDMVQKASEQVLRFLHQRYLSRKHLWFGVP